MDYNIWKDELDIEIEKDGNKMIEKRSNTRKSFKEIRRVVNTQIKIVAFSHHFSFSLLQDFLNALKYVRNN